MATLDTVTIPDDLNWVDEFSYSPAVQAVAPTLTGALWLESGAYQAGRPITLQGGANRAWIDRATVAALQALADQPGLEMDLIIRGEAARTVIFRHHEPPAFEAVPVASYGDPVDADYYYITLRLMEI